MNRLQLIDSVYAFRRWALLSTCGLLWVLAGSAAAAEPVSAIPTADREFLDTLEQRTFGFFWETTNPDNGLVPDRWPGPGPSSVAAVGFGLTAYCVGVERGYVTRGQAARRVRTTLRYLWEAPQSDDPSAATGHHGFFYHFLDMKTGRRYRDCELSSIDTSLLMAGVLACREYFAGDNAEEREIRDLADSLYRRVQWSWFQPPHR